jgi:hypothetical protein
LVVVGQLLLMEQTQFLAVLHQQAVVAVETSLQLTAQQVVLAVAAVEHQQVVARAGLHLLLVKETQVAQAVG